MSRLPALLLGTTIALAPAQIANTLSAPEVANVAEKVTVEDEKLGNSSSPTIGQTVYIAGAPPHRVRKRGREEWLWVALGLFVLCGVVFLVQLREQVPARYHKLRDLLSAGEWKEADLETRQVMLQVAGRESGGWQISDLENFPCKDLRAIDKLWVKYSNGCFCFSVQKRIWLEEGGKMNYKTACRMASRVGWRIEQWDLWLRYDDLTWGLDAPAGHLPIFPWGLAIEKLRKDREEKGIVGWVMDGVMDGVGVILSGVVGVVGVSVQVGVEKVGEAIIAAVMESL